MLLLRPAPLTTPQALPGHQTQRQQKQVWRQREWFASAHHEIQLQPSAIKKHSANLQRVTTIDAPVLAAVHRRLLKHNPDLVGAMSSSKSDSLASSSSSSSDGATQRCAASRHLTSNRGGTLKKSSDDIDFLAAKFATAKLSPSRTLSAPVTGYKKGHKVKGAV